jgi:hypothetical protein
VVDARLGTIAVIQKQERGLFLTSTLGNESTITKQ